MPPSSPLDPASPSAPAWLAPVIERLVEASGMVTLRGRPEDVGWAVTERATTQSGADVSAYATHLVEEPAAAEIERLLEMLTIGETYFFRHPEVFSALAEFAFPAFLERGGPVRFWSAACSIGCEAYTLAMAWQEFPGAHPAPPPLDVLGTDINAAFLRQARAADYGPWSLRNLPDDARNRLFTRNDNRFFVRERFRRDVRFEPMNLLHFAENPALGPAECDLILCRNVMIYFSPETNARLGEAFFRCLRPGGWFVTGASECNAEVFSRFEAVNTGDAILYRRPADSPTSPASTGAPFPPLPVERSAARPVRAPRRGRPLPARVAPEKTSPPAAGAPLRELLAERRWTDALVAAERAIALDPLDPETHLAAGLARAGLASSAAAETALRRCLYLRRDHPEAHANLALLLATGDRPEAAARHARLALRALESSPIRLLTFHGIVSVEELPAILETIITSAKENPR